MGEEWHGLTRPRESLSLHERLCQRGCVSDLQREAQRRERCLGTDPKLARRDDPHVDSFEFRFSVLVGPSSKIHYSWQGRFERLLIPPFTSSSSPTFPSGHKSIEILHSHISSHLTINKNHSRKTTSTITVTMKPNIAIAIIIIILFLLIVIAAIVIWRVRRGVSTPSGRAVSSSISGENGHI